LADRLPAIPLPTARQITNPINQILLFMVRLL
jgi:hypothetical protein